MTRRDLLTWALLAVLMVLYVVCLNKCGREKPQPEFRQPKPTVPTKKEVLKDSSTHYAAVTQTVTDKAEMKEALEEQKQLIRELNIKIRSLQAAQVTATEAEYKVPMPETRHDSVPTISTDSTQKTQPEQYNYHTKWIDVETAGDSLRIRTRDSVTVFITKIYRHRFLFWKWGTKGYNVDIVNHNPHSSITYQKTIMKYGK